MSVCTYFDCHQVTTERLASMAALLWPGFRGPRPFISRPCIYPAHRGMLQGNGVLRNLPIPEKPLPRAGTGRPGPHCRRSQRPSAFLLPMEVWSRSHQEARITIHPRADPVALEFHGSSPKSAHKPPIFASLSLEPGGSHIPSH